MPARPEDLGTYYQYLTRAKFVFSPVGSGLDCHRHYEALLFGPQGRAGSQVERSSPRLVSTGTFYGRGRSDSSPRNLHGRGGAATPPPRTIREASAAVPRPRPLGLSARHPRRRRDPAPSVYPRGMRGGAATRPPRTIHEAPAAAAATRPAAPPDRPSLAGAVPLVDYHASLVDLYRSLPVVFVAQWSKVTARTLEKAWATLTSRTWDFGELRRDRWRARVLAFRDPQKLADALAGLAPFQQPDSPGAKAFCKYFGRAENPTTRLRGIIHVGGRPRPRLYGYATSPRPGT